MEEVIMPTLPDPYERLGLPDPIHREHFGAVNWWVQVKGIKNVKADDCSHWYACGYWFGARGRHPSTSDSWTPKLKTMWMRGYQDGLHDYEHQSLIEIYNLW